MGDPECEMCQNCKRDIPVVNYKMHTLHCSRNVMLCPKCDEPVPRSGLEEHNEEFHTDKQCEMCKASVANNKIEDHKKNKCPCRVVICEYCKLDIKAGEREEHEGYCGSRTEKCPECSDFVMLKDWEKHEKMTLYHELAKKPCSQVFGYDPVREIAPVSSVSRAPVIPTDFDKVPSRKFSIADSLVNPKPTTSASAYVPTRKYSVDSYLEDITSPASSSNRFNAAISSSSRLGGRKDEDSIVSRYASRSNKRGEDLGDSYNFALPAPKQNGFGFPRPNLMDDLPSADADDLSSMPALEPLTPTKLISSLSFETASTKPPAPKPKPPSSKPPAPQPPKDVKPSNGIVEDEAMIPCEFCDEPIPILKIIKHQTDCTKNMDSLYFNAHLPTSTPAASSHTWPEVVTNALVSRSDTEKANGGLDDSVVRISPSPPNTSSNPPVSRLIDIGGVEDESRLESPPPPLPPKVRNKAFGGARPKKKASEASIVGKYLSDPKVGGNNRRSQSRDGKKKSSSSASSKRSNSRARNKDTEEATISKHKPTNGIDPSDFVSSRVSKGSGNPSTRHKYEGSFSSKVNSNGFSTDILLGSDGSGGGSSESSLFSGTERYLPRPTRLDLDSVRTNPTRDLLSSSSGDTERDEREREKLRDMLSGLRKDPFDEDLENNDGSFFPCEFCGDPYPVEFLMRHQLSCDLNPQPVTSGQGFDYTQIRARAEQNMDLAKPPTGM